MEGIPASAICKACCRLIGCEPDSLPHNELLYLGMSQLSPCQETSLYRHFGCQVCDTFWLLHIDHWGRPNGFRLAPH